MQFEPDTQNASSTRAMNRPCVERSGRAHHHDKELTSDDRLCMFAQALLCLSPAQMQEMYAVFNAWKEKFQANILDIGGKLNRGGKIVTESGVTDGPFI